jgi:hypothetical protein
MTCNDVVTLNSLVVNIVAEFLANNNNQKKGKSKLE